MPRRARVVPPDSVVHVVNRGVEKRRLFEGPSDFEEFLGLVDRACERSPMRVLGYALMPNHWHLVLWPVSFAELSQFLHYVTTLHASRFRHRSSTGGYGHVYQGRYWSSVLDGDVGYVRTLCYVESNPLRAGLVTRAEEWQWTSLFERLNTAVRIVDGPVPLPCLRDWTAFVNAQTADH
jgi:putative transposase